MALALPWWQLALAVWGVGSVAAFPLALEFNDGLTDDEGAKVPGWVEGGLSILFAMAWPFAWVSLIAWTLGKVARRG